MERPNFVILVADQLRADALGCFGSRIAKTPHLDELASRGTRFGQAYVQHPVCSPSRASFLTGWYPHVRGHRTLTHLLQADEPNLLRILREAGYHVAWAGERGDTFAPGVTELSVDEYGYATPPARSGRVGSSIGAGYASELWGRLFYRGLVSGDEPDADEAAVRTAERWLAGAPSRPWVLFLPFFAPHVPFQVAEPWFSLHDRARMPSPVAPGGGREARFKKTVRDRYGLDSATPEMWAEIAAVYHGMVARLDDHVGRVMAATRATGQGERTVTLFFSDHGEYLGDFGLIEKWPTALDRCITWDPLIVAGGRLPAGRSHNGLVELIDIVPTVLELAGVPAGYDHFGRSLVPAIRDPGLAIRSLAFSEAGFVEREEPKLERGPYPYDLKGELQHEDPRLVGRAVAVRDARWTYVWRLYEPPELYDRQVDPHETANLAGRPGTEEPARRLEAALLRWQVETSDVLSAVIDPRQPEVRLSAPGGLRTN